MNKSAKQAALDQANLLATYLAETPSTSLDLLFIRRHLDALDSFAQAAKLDTALVHWSDRAPDGSETDAMTAARITDPRLFVPKQ